MKRFFLTLLVGVAFTLSASAQSNYKPGYVIKSSGDTVMGYVNYHEWDLAPSLIEFKTTLNSNNTEKLYPVQLKGFEITGIDKYITYKGPISMDKNTLPDLPYQLDTTTVLNTVFLHTIYQGPSVSLFSYQDNLKSRIFVQENSALPIELKYYQYYTNDSNVRSIEAYKDQLLRLAQKYSSNFEKVSKEIRYTQFQESSLFKILKSINNDTRTSNVNKSGGSRLFFGILFHQTTTQFDGDNAFTGIKSSNHIPRLSVGIDVFTNKNVQKFLFRGELAFSSINPQFETFTEATPFEKAFTTTYKFKQNSIIFTPQFIYNLYNKDAFKLFAGVGISINYSFYTNNKITYSNKNDVEGYSLEKLWMNFPIQAGVTLNKKLDVFATYTYPNSFTKYNFFSISNKVYGIGVHYFLSK